MENLFGSIGNMPEILKLALPFAFWIAIFYFLLILPNKRKQKKHTEMVNALKEGTEVLTSGGIKGTILSVNGEYADIRVDKGVKLTVKKASILTIIK